MSEQELKPCEHKYLIIRWDGDMLGWVECELCGAENTEELIALAENTRATKDESSMPSVSEDKGK